MLSSASTDNGRPVLIGGGLAVGFGVLVSLLIAATAPKGPHWSTGLQLVAYLLASMSIAGVLGLIFAVPRVRTEQHDVADAAHGTSERFSANSNLEQISDWLTKILVGAGLVQIASAPKALAALGDYLGKGLPIPNAPAACVGVVVYGIAGGFLFTYLWGRLRLRVLLEASEKQAEEQSRREEVVASLAAASAKSTNPESTRSISRAVTVASQAVERSPTAGFRAVLWVDDHPGNNVDIADALRTLGIPVDLALSTEEALRLLNAQRHGLVITDLGRTEDGEEVVDAGVDLLQEIRRRGIQLPVFVYAGRRAVDREEELLEQGATLATNRPTEVFTRAVEIITGAPPRG